MEKVVTNTERGKDLELNLCIELGLKELYELKFKMSSYIEVNTNGNVYACSETMTSQYQQAHLGCRSWLLFYCFLHLKVPGEVN